jgi:hypothetical protein
MTEITESWVKGPGGAAAGRYLRQLAHHDPEPPLTDDRFRATKTSTFPINEQWH